MKILVFGASGQLGECLKIVSMRNSIGNISFPKEEIANILDYVSLVKLFEEERPSCVVNCAAYTAVDKAEAEVEIARKVNRDGAVNLAKLCKKYNAVLIHVSTDFVFEGSVIKLLKETDSTEPVNVYGLTKLEGEKAIAAELDRFFVLRTSWLYSEHGNNFVKTMLRIGNEREEIKVIADQIGSPTYAIDLAEMIFHIIFSDNTAYGIYHFSNEGAVSWFDFAKAIFEISGIDVNVLPVPTSEYVTKARRPAFSVMDKAKIKHAFGVTIPYWRDSLEVCIKQLKSLNI